MEVKTDPGSNGDELQSGNAPLDESRLDFSGLSSLNIREVSFKPNPSSRTYDKSLPMDGQAGVSHIQRMQEDSGPNEIPVTGMFECSERTQENSDLRESVQEEEMLGGDAEEASQMSPSQSVISAKRHHVPDTVDESSMPWPQASYTELKDTRSDKGKTTYFPPDYIVYAVQKFKDAHSSARFEKDIPTPPPPTQSKKLSRRKAKRRTCKD